MEVVSELAVALTNVGLAFVGVALVAAFIGLGE